MFSKFKSLEDIVVMSELDENSEQRKNYKPKKFVGRKEKWFGYNEKYDYEAKKLKKCDEKWGVRGMDKWF